ncbi:MAG: hypothetical protein V2A73_06995 [Pseudomonadota bacterium]
MLLADLGRMSIRRNALIADLLHRIGFIEKAGTGHFCGTKSRMSLTGHG